MCLKRVKYRLFSPFDISHCTSFKSITMVLPRQSEFRQPSHGYFCVHCRFVLKIFDAAYGDYLINSQKKNSLAFKVFPACFTFFVNIVRQFIHDHSAISERLFSYLPPIRLFSETFLIFNYCLKKPPSRSYSDFNTLERNAFTTFLFFCVKIQTRSCKLISASQLGYFRELDKISINFARLFDQHLASNARGQFFSSF